MRNKILVYDDDPELATQWKKQIETVGAVRKSFDIEVMFESPTELQKDLQILAQRQRSFRAGTPWPNEPTRFDEGELLVIDYDLITQESFATGEVVAYLARCFSSCGVIIGLNQYGGNTFDLTLRGHPESFCDLNIGDQQLSNPGLWTHDFKGFRPWCWPVLIDFLSSFRRRVTEALENASQYVLSYFGLDGVLQHIPKSVLGFLGPDPITTSFDQFPLKSPSGLHPRDKRVPEESHTKASEVIARVAAARLSKWLQRLVLPGQNIIVDAPHLVSRFPSLLLSGNHDNPESWNKTARFVEPSGLGIHHEIISQFEFHKPDWIARPAWFWPGLSNHPEVAEVSSPWETESSDLVFCEDTSGFHPKKACRKFVAGVDSPFIIRYVKMPDTDVDYQPYGRFSSKPD